MLKLIIAALLAVLVAVFAIDNMHPVELGCVAGKPVNVRLFFLLLTSFLVGCMATTIVNLYIGTRTKRAVEGTAAGAEADYFSEED
ncbi:MAG: hypothetical protein ACYS47_10065 [Planctomycetota bacterium]|jgi:uncharacterized integral membrane protein